MVKLQCLEEAWGRIHVATLGIISRAFGDIKTTEKNELLFLHLSDDIRANNSWRNNLTSTNWWSMEISCRTTVGALGT